jgi:hypothetical protein
VVVVGGAVVAVVVVVVDGRVVVTRSVVVVVESCSMAVAPSSAQTVKPATKDAVAMNTANRRESGRTRPST